MFYLITIFSQDITQLARNFYGNDRIHGSILAPQLDSSYYTLYLFDDYSISSILGLATPRPSFSGLMESPANSSSCV